MHPHIDVRAILGRQTRRLKIAGIAIAILVLYLLFCNKTPAPRHLMLLKENFPSAASAKTPNDFPSIPTWNKPPNPHVNLSTPLYIGFSRNFPLLQQTVVSYITAGWPTDDIYIVDNTGTMLSNKRGKLTLQNPSFLDYHRLEMLGVNIIPTPTLLSFAQLQNFFLHEALRRGWTYYFWSHMDVVALSTPEDDYSGEYRSLYLRAVADFESSLLSNDWVIRFYAYDWLALVSVAGLDALGGYDPFIPYYPADCDINRRSILAGFHNPSPIIGKFYDVAETVEDVEVFYHAQPGSQLYKDLNNYLSILMREKTRQGDRNTWQVQQQGGQNEPYSYNIQGFELMQSLWIRSSRNAYKAKWGTSDCWPKNDRSIAQPWNHNLR